MCVCVCVCVRVCVCVCTRTRACLYTHCNLKMMINIVSIISFLGCLSHQHWLVVWVLWRINLCRLFNAKFCLYVYTFNQRFLNEYLGKKFLWAGFHLFAHY